MRQRKHKNRKSTQAKFELDIIVPGLGALTGDTDRFRCSAETRDALVFAERRLMVADLGRRLLHEVLAARLKGRFSTEALALAYKQGEAALTALLTESRRKPLAPLRDAWMELCEV